MMDTVCIINYMKEKEITEKTLKKIRELRKEKGISSDKLGELVGLTGGAIRHIERGQRKLTLPLLEKIAQALGVSVAELLTTREEKREKLNEVEEITDTVILPVLSDVPAGGFRGGDVEIIDYLPTPRDALRGVPKDFVAWWTVSGTSMTPDINPGDKVLVADGSWIEINNGDKVIAVIDGERTLKKFYDKGDYIVLQPVNDKDHEPIIIPKNKLKETNLYLYKVLGVFKRY